MNQSFQKSVHNLKNDRKKIYAKKLRLLTAKKIVISYNCLITLIRNLSKYDTEFWCKPCCFRFKVKRNKISGCQLPFEISKILINIFKKGTTQKLKRILRSNLWEIEAKIF